MKGKTNLYLTIDCQLAQYVGRWVKTATIWQPTVIVVLNSRRTCQWMLRLMADFDEGWTIYITWGSLSRTLNIINQVKTEK